MSRITTLLFAGLATLLLIASDISIVGCKPDTTVTFIECNTNRWGPGDPYGDNVDDALFRLVNETPDNTNYTYATTDVIFGGTVAYGYASCGSRLDPDDCLACLEEGADQLDHLCSYAVGAQLVMVDCKMRYENYPF